MNSNVIKHKIKVTYVVTNLRNTGPINQTYNLIRFLDRDKFEPSVITIWPETEDTIIDLYRSLGIKIIQGRLSRKSSLLFGKRYVTKILEILKPDIVQGVGIPLYRMCLGYKKAVPYVVLRNYCYEDYPSQYGKIIGLLMACIDMKLIRCQLNKGLPITTCSKSLSDIYKKNENLNISYIQNGVDVSRFKKTEIIDIDKLRDTLCLPRNKVIFVYSGRLIERKNQIESIKAFIKANLGANVVLLILGDGPDRTFLESIAVGHENIIFKGNVSEIERYLFASDIYVSSSKSEGLPNGVLEAMACGLPVILSNIPQHLEVMDDNSVCGYTYQLGDVLALSNTIKKMIKSNYKQFGESSLNRVNTCFTDRIMSENYSKLYQQMLKKL